MVFKYCWSVLNVVNLILGVVTAELKEDYDGEPSLIIHPNGLVNFVSDDISKDLSSSDGK